LWQGILPRYEGQLHGLFRRHNYPLGFGLSAPVATISTGAPFRTPGLAAISTRYRFTQSGDTPPMAENTDDRLRLLIERVERLEEEKKGIGDDIKDVYLEAKAVGYDVKIMRQIVRLRKMAPDDRKEMEAILDLYKAALGLG
jgi:uncharacterized protein (UPF0335 family)